LSGYLSAVWRSAPVVDALAWVTALDEPEKGGGGKGVPVQVAVLTVQVRFVSAGPPSSDGLTTLGGWLIPTWELPS
jgi:hypothetical protein